MTAKRSHIHRRWAMLAVSVTVVLHGIVGFPGTPGQSINQAVAQGNCDAQCWAIHRHLRPATRVAYNSCGDDHRRRQLCVRSRLAPRSQQPGTVPPNADLPLGSDPDLSD